jgi:hypothetical protein
MSTLKCPFLVRLFWAGIACDLDHSIGQEGGAYIASHIDTSVLPASNEMNVPVI